VTGCRSHADLIGPYVLGALEPDEMETMRRHIAACPRCAAEVRSLSELPALLDQATADEEVATLSPGLEDEVLDRFVRERAKERPRRRRWQRVGIPATAAAALLAGILVAVVPGGQDTAYATAKLRSVASGAGATAIRAASRSCFAPGEKIRVDKGTAAEEVRTVVSITNPNPPSPSPNVTLDAPLAQAHPEGAVLGTEACQAGVGFQPDYATEGRPESLEFAAGNYGLLESALDYARDDEPPVVRMTGPTKSSGPIETTFEFVNEPSVIRYTMDGSKPTGSSPLWDSTGPREPGQVFHLDSTTTFRWTATDIKGNASSGKETFKITG
jgi:anti-sigma factor RsiW